MAGDGGCVMDARRARKHDHSGHEVGTSSPQQAEELGSAGHFRALTLFAEAPDTVRAARDTVRAWLETWGLVDLCDDVRLVVSELVSNVVQHAVPDSCLTLPGASRRVEVTVTTWPGLLCIGVGDEDSTPPDLPVGECVSPALAGDLPEALLPDQGRGLLITQRLADSVWWSPKEPGGKTVWARFDIDNTT
ncbi:ATP-binding protein [Streptomyces sp. G45]|uniref:ATP-binding protein n=1 Tax=Streptomyces sp. G45 TaxID=3406627 RepID=UPI003C1C3067